MPQDVYIYNPDVHVPENVQYVEIPQGITVIKENAFWNCRNLQSVTIPDSVTKIGDGAFARCPDLQTITIPNSVTEIGEGAFEECSGLQSITIPDSVTKIGDSAFWHCHSLKSVTIPDSVTEIGNQAFLGCSGLQSITIPDSVTEIGEGAFEYCFGLQSITIPDSVTEIGYSAFTSCTGLQSVTIPDSVNKIGQHAFKGCSGLQSVTISDGVTKIGSYAFCDCSALQSVTIPDGITKIGSYTFHDCSALQSVTIPDGVTEIGDNAFSGCSCLCLITIPDSVTEIGANAFNKCAALQSVTIPDGVTKIGNCAFTYCTSLRSVAIPGSVTEIRAFAFDGCSGLQSITIPDSVTEIGDYAFHSCSRLQSVTIPNSVTEIGDCAFWDCSGLQSVTIPDSVTKIGENAFLECSALQSITIPDSVKKIEINAFKNCKNLQSVTISNGVTKIGSYAFCGCSALCSVTIPDSVTKIDSSAFEECVALQSVTIPDSVTKIGRDAFLGCSGLQSVTIPDGVTEIGNEAFAGCYALQSVIIPDSVTEIGGGAFWECSALQSLLYKGVNIAPVINIDGYGVNTFDVIKTLIEHGIPLNENTVKIGIDMEHRGKLPEWIREYPLFGTMHLSADMKSPDGITKEQLRQCFAGQKRTKHRIPQILDELAITARACGIPQERLAKTFDIEYTKKLLSKKIPIVPAEACRCYYDRGTCDMLIRKGNISVMAEAISLYNRSGHRECYRHLMEFIRSHPDTKTENLQYAADHAEGIPMRAETTLAQVRQHRTYTEGLAEVTKIEARYGKIVPEFRLSDYPCNIEPVGVTYNEMPARVLDLSNGKDIALAARLGDLTNCCQRLDAAGETAMMHGFLNPDAGFWVIEDKDGNIKAQAEIWKTKNGNLIFDNIEFANTDKEHLTDRADRLRGVIAAWAMESGYKNIIMGCGSNELGIDSMEQAPIPELRLTPEEVFALQKGNDAGVFFRNINAVRRYMRTEKYNPNDFVYTDADKQCVYIKKDGIVSDYLMQGYDCTLTEKHPSSGHETEKERSEEIVCK